MRLKVGAVGPGGSPTRWFRLADNGAYQYCSEPDAREFTKDEADALVELVKKCGGPAGYSTVVASVVSPARSHPLHG